MQNQNQPPDEGDVIDVKPIWRPASRCREAKYRIRVDKQQFVVAVSEMRGRNPRLGRENPEVPAAPEDHGTVVPVGP